MKNTIPAVIKAPLLAGLNIPNMANTKQKREGERERKREREKGE